MIMVVVGVLLMVLGVFGGGGFGFALCFVLLYYLLDRG